MKLQIGQLAQCSVFSEVFGRSSKNEFAWNRMGQVSLRELHPACKLTFVVPGWLCCKKEDDRDGLGVSSDRSSCS